MKGMVVRRGVVADLSPTLVTVTFESRSACASCHAVGSCTSLDKSEKVVEVASNYAPGGLTVGEEVDLFMPTRDGQIALLIGHIIPIALLLCVVALGRVWMSDLLAALLSLLVVASYYLGLIKLTPHLKFTIRIKKLPLKTN
jgi:sigma-E factor negative regulatory protein RseC